MNLTDFLTEEEAFIAQHEKGILLLVAQLYDKTKPQEFTFYGDHPNQRLIIVPFRQIIHIPISGITTKGIDFDLIRYSAEQNNRVHRIDLTYFLDPSLSDSPKPIFPDLPLSDSPKPIYGIQTSFMSTRGFCRDQAQRPASKISRRTTDCGNGYK